MEQHLLHPKYSIKVIIVEMASWTWFHLNDLQKTEVSDFNILILTFSATVNLRKKAPSVPWAAG